MLDNIPQELRERAQFVVWRYEQKPGSPKPTKPPYNANSGWPANVTDRKTWATYDKALDTLQRGGFDGIGYVIAPDDPYTFIDLDTHDERLSDEDKARHQRIAETFAGYAEISPSGKGLHLIVKGKVPSGRRRAGVEVYSGERYMTLTGNVWRNGNVIEQQALLDVLHAELGENRKEIIAVNQTEQTEDDSTICERAFNATNGEKFLSLYQGKWQENYQSQSEADFALIDILAFYTQNQQQIKRIFRASALGTRDKAKRDSYLDSMIVRSFDNQPPKVNLEALKHNLELDLAAQRQVEPILAPTAHPFPDPLPTPSDAAIYALPPGLVGELAAYVYASAPRPVREIALVASIGLLAGICGRAYNVSNAGLNQYLLLLAPTGSGKETIAHGISTIMECVKAKVPAAIDFIGPGQIRSDIGLFKHLAKRSSSIVSVVGEFGHTLAQMASGSGANMNMKAIKQMMLDLYAKSAQGAVLQSAAYSDTDKSIAPIKSPSFTFIGESAPQPFYESVDERLISDGLLPRFTLIEYNGPRPPLNENAGFPPPNDLVERMASICAQCLMLNKADRVVQVEYAPEAKAQLNAYNVQCDAYMNGADTETIRHIWNRAHIRALKMAALIAVGQNPFAPLIDEAAALWAINLSAHNTQKLLQRFERGETGSVVSDSQQMRDLCRQANYWITKPYSDFSKSLPDYEAMHTAKVIPHSFLSRRLLNMASYKTDRLGATTALKRAIQNAIDSGVIAELPKHEMAKLFNTNGKGLVVSNYSLLKHYL